MKNKALWILPFVFVLSLTFILGANIVTIATPVQDASISGSTYLLNATLDTNTLNLTSANFFYDDGSSNTTIGTTANDSLIEFNYTWDTTALVDINNYIIWVNITNSTYTNDFTGSLDSSTGVDIDNGNPTASLSSSSFADNLALVSSTSFTVAIDADSTIGISSCNIYYINENDNSIITQSVTASANSCSATTTPSTQSLGINEAYNVTMEATDGNGDAVNSTGRTLRVTPTSAGGGSSSSTTQEQGEEDASDTGSVPSQNIGFFQKILNWIRGLFSRNY